MSTGELLDRSFNLYRSHFLLFAGTAVTYSASVTIGCSFLVAGPMPTEPNGPTEAFILLLVELVLGFFAVTGYAFAGGSTTYAVSRIHLGYAVTIRNSYSKVRPLLFRLVRIQVSVFFRGLGAVLLMELVIGVVGSLLVAVLTAKAPEAMPWPVGLLVLLLFIAGSVWPVRIVCRYSLAVPACVLEKLRAAEAIKRSKALSEGALGRIFLVFLLTTSMGAGLFWVLNESYFLLPSKLSFPFNITWSLSAIFLAFTLAFPVGTIALSLLYYDLRVRKEAFDLQLMMESIVPPQAEQAQAGAGTG